MSRACLMISAIAVLWISVVICNDCLFQDQMWQYNLDPRKFQYCDTRTNKTALGTCPSGSGFVRNNTASGCVPWNDWNDTCVNKIDETNVTCNEINYQQPQPAIDPEYFFLCPIKNGTAVRLKCPNGKAFYSKNKYLGCFEWIKWRNLTQCFF